MKIIYIKSLILSFLLFGVFNSCKSPDNTDVMQDWNTLSGKWESYKGVVFCENWKMLNDSLYSGIGFSLNGNDTMFSEKLALRIINDSVYYQAYVSGEKSPTSFSLREYSSSDWLFVNERNEFPKKIHYVLENDTLLTVTISDMELNKKQLFYLRKVK